MQRLTKDLSLLNEASDSNLQKTAQIDEPRTSDSKKKWNPPPGYFSQANKEQTLLKRIKTKNSRLNEGEIRKILKATQREWKPLPNYNRKDVFIKRKKKALMKQNPQIQAEIAEKEANERYIDFVKGRRERVENKKEENRKTKEYMKSVD